MVGISQDVRGKIVYHERALVVRPGQKCRRTAIVQNNVIRSNKYTTHEHVRDELVTQRHPSSELEVA